MCAESMGSARRHPTKWKAKFGRLEVSDARRWKALENENAKLKRLLAEQMLDNGMLKDVAPRKWLRPLRSEMLSPTCARGTR